MKLHTLVESTRRSVGFTIVELLITVAVIGILASISFVGFNAAQANTRDSARAGEVAVIMDALEQYYRKNGDYPANDTMNPSQFYPTMTDFSAIKTLMPSLTDDALKGPGGYSFYPACLNSAWCPNGSADWPYSMKKYLYLSRFVAGGSPGTYWWYRVPSTYAGNTGWGCDVQTYYTDPGYVLAWYSESKKIWIFKRSQHGQVDMANNATAGPIAPQTCAFS